jgi:hypothetical protein
MNEWKGHGRQKMKRREHTHGKEEEEEDRCVRNPRSWELGAILLPRPIGNGGVNHNKANMMDGHWIMPSNYKKIFYSYEEINHCCSVWRGGGDSPTDLQFAHLHLIDLSSRIYKIPSGLKIRDFGVGILDEIFRRRWTFVLVSKSYTIKLSRNYADSSRYIHIYRLKDCSSDFI